MGVGWECEPLNKARMRGDLGGRGRQQSKVFEPEQVGGGAVRLFVVIPSHKYSECGLNPKIQH